jgi:hypothetical protein
MRCQIGNRCGRICLSFVMALLVMTPTFVLAMFMMDVEGIVTITEDQAPVRDEYPDGRILDVVSRGTQFSIHRAAGDGRGTWIEVTYKKDKKEIRGFIDARFTSFWTDFKTGKIKQPKH